MALLTLLAIANLIRSLNRSNYLRDYRSRNLPNIGVLVLVLTLPLAILDLRVTDGWLKLTWFLLLVTGTLATAIDLELHLLPDRLVLPTLIASMALNVVSGHGRSSILGAVGWFAGFAILAIINPVGLGWGDVKFAALLGAHIGAIDLRLVPRAIFLGLILGGGYALYRIARGDRQNQIPFGPFMFLGALAALI